MTGNGKVFQKFLKSLKSGGRGSGTIGLLQPVGEGQDALCQGNQVEVFGASGEVDQGTRLRVGPQEGVPSGFWVGEIEGGGDPLDGHVLLLGTGGWEEAFLPRELRPIDKLDPLAVRGYVCVLRHTLIIKKVVQSVF